MSAIPELQTIDAQLLAVVSRHWGYDAFRPLQREAMHAVLSAPRLARRAADRRRQVALLSRRRRSCGGA